MISLFNNIIPYSFRTPNTINAIVEKWNALIGKSNSTYSTVSFQRTDTELVSSVPITTGSPFTFTTVYKLTLPEILKGDLITVHTSGECRQDNNYNCQVTCAVYMSPDAIFDIYNPLIVPIVIGSGYNITLQVHYGVFPRSATWVADKNYSGQYMHFVWWFASTDAGVGNTMTVMAGQGYLTTRIERI